jgi:hypothetical protein
MSRILLLTLSVALTACAATPPPANVFQSAEAAIKAAERAGAAELSPVELGFARERLELARQAMENKKYDAVFLAIEQSEINAELAIEQSRTVTERRRVNELRRSNELLLEELQGIYGEVLQ